MMISAPAQPVAIDPKKPISVDVEYWTPSFVRTHLGGTPEDVFDQDPNASEGPYVPCTPEKCGPLPNEIYRNNPVREADGSPKLQRLVKRLEDKPATPLDSFGLWGLMGGAAAGTIGILGGAMLGSPVLGGVIGSVLGGGIAGGVGAWRARGDCIRLVWDVRPIVETRYVGYKEEVRPAEQGGQKGYVHHFVPDLQAVTIGEYKIPRIEHYREGR